MAPYDCNFCMAKMETTLRKMWHCGYIPKDEWLPMQPESMPPIGDKRVVAKKSDDPDRANRELETNICPGWIVRQPSVIQASEAGAALEKCSLPVYYPRCDNAVLEAAMLMVGARGTYTSWSMKRGKNG